MAIMNKIIQLSASVMLLAACYGVHGDVVEEVVEERVESEDATFRVVKVIDGLEHPWSLAFLPDGGMLVTERPGRMHLFEGGELRSISGLPEVTAQGQGGLFDVLPHPEFASNRLVYFAYSDSYEGGVGTKVSRAVLEDDNLRDVELLFRMEPPGTGGRHFGGRLAFDSDQYLFVTIGDRADQDRAQDLDVHHGKLLRLHDDGSIPEDNPFVDRDDALPEIYSYGHRNAQGLVYDARSDRLWQHEHGPYGGDALHLIEPGANYGWPEATYGVQYGDRSKIGVPPDQRDDIVDPIVHWTTPSSIAPSGLALYESRGFPKWHGNLFVGALAHEHIRRVVLDATGQVVHEEELLRDQIGRIREVRSGPDGTLWFTTDATRGAVYRIEPAGGPAP